MVRVTVEDDNGNNVLTTVQAHRGWTSLNNSYKHFKDASAALIEKGVEDGYTESRGVFNIVPCVIESFQSVDNCEKN